MNVIEQRKICFGEVKRESEGMNRNCLLLCDKEATAKQRRALTQAMAIISKTVKHIGKVMALGCLLMLLLFAGCEQAGWFAAGAITDATMQAEQRRKIYADLMDDPNMVKILVAAASSEVVTPEQEQMILDAITKYEQLHGTAAVIKTNAKDPAWWAAFILGLTAAYQKYQRTKEGRPA